MTPVVSIIMGSTSDLPVMEKAAKFLDEMEIPFEMHALSAHRTPAEVEAFAKGAKGRGIKVIIAAAGMAAHLCGVIASMTTGLAVNVSAADEKSDFAGEELSILVSAGWMDNRYDETIKRFEDTYDVTVDLQTIPADQYSDLLQSKLATDSCADIFWIQSNPFAIESTIVDPEKYCIDFTGASWENVMPETRKESCVYNDKLY